METNRQERGSALDWFPGLKRLSCQGRKGKKEEKDIEILQMIVVLKFR
ncbi:hypothetical protein [Nostoc sp. FACHB-190]|nr:hypothetical protein [Nostoc sp. FACHB-190]MBD2303518.1 hypothetical protein [Nostoc sp. FACHB-190]